MPAARGSRRTLGRVTTHAPSTEYPVPGAEHPARQYDLDADGLRIAVHEWGDEDAPPLIVVHGGFDFARTYDIFAPKLAAGGWRVVGWDQRGHGDSEHPELYSWDADMRDALTVFGHVSPGRPMPVVGHSKGGALMTQLADAQPFRFTHLVNMDGIPYNRRIPDVAEHERTKMVATEIAGWLDHRRSTATEQTQLISAELPGLAAEQLVGQSRHGVGQRRANERRQVTPAIQSTSQRQLTTAMQPGPQVACARIRV